MVQGTMSNAGKSIVTAGILRVLKQDGYRVAPFKSQNMALNSYITKDGLEMGRAQVMQAEAAGIEPCVQMNPILLKPTSDVGSQVIVNGVPLKNMPAKEYFKYKKKLIPDILSAYETLDRQYDVIVLEDLAYFAMDFRQDLSKPYQAPYQPSVAHYTDNYVLLISGSKAFSYAGQRIGVSCISDKLYHRSYPGLTKRYGG